MDQISYKLDVFEGPMDLLLSLIAKHKLNIYDIPIANNIATADFLVRSSLMDNEYIHKVENFKKKVADRAETLEKHSMES